MKILETQIVKEGKYLLYVILNGFYEVVFRKHPKVVAIIALTDNNEVILIEQFRHGRNVQTIEFPAGLMDKENETAMARAQGELEEETGHKAGTMLMVEAGSISAGMSNEFLYLFLATKLYHGKKEDSDESRGIIVHTVPLNEIEEFLAAQKRADKEVDIKTSLAIGWLKNYIAEQDSLNKVCLRDYDGTD